MAENARHLFSGSNTAEGYWGYLGTLQRMAGRTVIIKGGPGVGKSTLMKKTGSHYEEKGMQVYYYHCSGDPDSVDAVFVPERGFLMADGTAPHVLDPVCPGAADGILNLGVCLNERQLADQQAEIAAHFAQVSAAYARAYRYLESAAAMRRDTEAVYRGALEADARRRMENELLSHVPQGEGGGEMHGFVQAITCQGVVQHTKWLEAGQVVCLDLPFGLAADLFLQPVLHLARQRGLALRCWYDPLEGRRISHLQAGYTLFTTAVAPGCRIISPPFSKTEMARENSRLSFNRAVYDLCLHQAVDVLAEAKVAHDRLERYYIDAMDYGRLQAVTREVMEDLP